ncbi:MAG: hypothetical protein JWO36_4619 [Myxococcales bacterium]|nr:hypothetical protein [Myxococcales bacterium]
MTQRVLVVDDSWQNRLVAQGHLEAAGYEVVAAASGEEALELMAKQPVDLVVLDVLMPGLGGFETCRQIRVDPTMADTPVLFLTALGDREATAPALEAGADDLLAKPFHRSELLLRAKALIRQHETALELRNAMRALAEHNEQMQRLERDKRRMSELIAHDLKGPLVGIMANAELLRLASFPGELGDAVEDILVAATHVDRTARDLLDLSRAEAAALTIDLESFDVAGLATEVASSLRGFGRWTGVVINIDSQVASTIADRELLRRMLQNLVHNAVKHAPKGSEVRIEARVQAGDLLVRVLDEGPGIPEADVDRIFESGVTLDSHKGGGHGLGLAFCKLAVEAHGGSIWVEDREPRGAAFCVRIPQPR